MRLRLAFRGRVQGVGFRATASAIAKAYPITGWVRNEPDGAVMLEVQGAETDIQDYLSDLQRVMSRNISSTTRLEIPDVSDELLFEVRA